MNTKTTSRSVSKDTPMAAKQGYTDFTKRAFAPATKLNETVVENVERLVKFQYQLAGDFMNFALEQLHATTNVSDLPTYFAGQREIATKFAETAQQRQQALAKMAADSQASFATW